MTRQQNPFQKRLNLPAQCRIEAQFKVQLRLADFKFEHAQTQPFQGVDRIRFAWPGFSQWRRGHRFCMPFVALVSSWDRADVSCNVAG